MKNNNAFQGIAIMKNYFVFFMFVLFELSCSFSTGNDFLVSDFLALSNYQTNSGSLKTIQLEIDELKKISTARLVHTITNTEHTMNVKPSNRNELLLKIGI